MDTAGLSRVAPVSIETVPSVEQNTENREIIRAVHAVNGTEIFGQENQLRFQTDPQTNRIVIRIENRKTGEVVMQIPNESVLRLAGELKKQCR